MERKQSNTSGTRVLIIAVNPAEEGVFAPLIYGELRSYADSIPELKERVGWLDPVILPIEPEDAPEAEIYAASVYEWNAFYVYDFCSRLRQLHPDSCIFAGGPEVDWKDASFFEEHPYFDGVMPGDGEIAFSDILSCITEGRDLGEARGFILNPDLYPGRVFSPAPAIDMMTRPSPWLSLKDFWLDFFRKYGHLKLALSFESSRGCPYGCTYCDWGGESKGRLLAVPEDVALEEMDFIQRELKPFFIFWTDGNLGILERDVRLAARFAYNRKHFGSPFSLYYNCNKNNYERNLQIAESLREAKLLTKYVLALQHTDPEVLKNIGRRNLSMEDIGKIAEYMNAHDIPVYVQYIIGCPGDSFEKWMRAFTQLMELGIHGEYRVYPFGLFPNAKAASPEYMKKWEIDAPYRQNYVAFYTLKKDEISYTLSRSRYVMGSTGVSREMYGEMLTLSLTISALHDHGFTRFIAIGARECCGISYEDFYTKLYHDLKAAGLLSAAERFSHKWITDENSAFIAYSEDSGCFVESEESIVFDIYDRWDEFYSFMRSFAVRNKIPSDLVEYQEKILYRPESCPPDEREIELPAKWAEFFDNVPGDGRYSVGTGRLLFGHPWYKEEDPPRRRKAFYAQIVQHNAVGAKRTAFKDIESI